MNYNDYLEANKDVKALKELECKPSIIWLHMSVLPVGVVSLGDIKDEKIKIPARFLNSYGVKVPINTIYARAFAKNDKITDIILPSCVSRISPRAFAGCTNLKNITIPRKVTTICEGTFAGCVNLENIYYEGTPDEWKQVEIVHEKHEIEFGDIIPGTPTMEIAGERLIHIPGNEPVFNANIHFRCKLEYGGSGEYAIIAKGKDITENFRVKA